MGNISGKLKAARCPYVSAVVVAAGSGTRFGSDKMNALLNGKPVLLHTLQAFEAAQIVREIVVVAREDALEEIAALCRQGDISKVSMVVPGGATRALSCYAGVISTASQSGIIAIHDGARPFVTEKIIEDTVWMAYRRLAAVPAVPVRDTVKIAAGGVVTATPQRSCLFAVQTPQCFQANLIRAALTDAVKNAPNVTDDCLAVERIGGKIYLTEGSEENIKITTPLDLALGELILKRRAQL